MSRVFKVFLVCEEIDKDGQVLVLEDRYYFKEYKIPDGILFSIYISNHFVRETQLWW